MIIVLVLSQLIGVQTNEVKLRLIMKFERYTVSFAPYLIVTASTVDCAVSV